MVTQKSVVFVNCVHHGCSCQRMFLLRDGEELPHYACIKHRRLYTLEVSVLIIDTVLNLFLMEL